MQTTVRDGRVGTQNLMRFEQVQMCLQPGLVNNLAFTLAELGQTGVHVHSHICIAHSWMEQVRRLGRCHSIRLVSIICMFSFKVELPLQQTFALSKTLLAWTLVHHRDQCSSQTCSTGQLCFATSKPKLYLLTPLVPTHQIWTLETPKFPNITFAFCSVWLDCSLGGCVWWGQFMLGLGAGNMLDYAFIRGDTIRLQDLSLLQFVFSTFPYVNLIKLFLFDLMDIGWTAVSVLCGQHCSTWSHH